MARARKIADDHRSNALVCTCDPASPAYDEDVPSWLCQHRVCFAFEIGTCSGDPEPLWYGNDKWKPGMGVHCWCMKGAFWEIGPDGRDTLIGARHTRSMRIKEHETERSISGYPAFHDGFPWDPDEYADPGNGFPILGPPHACL